mgnify:CR=1 FL=1
MYVCMFGHVGRGNMTKMAHTYIHGPIPFQKGLIFPCMFTFAHAGRGNRAPGDHFELQEAAPQIYIHTYRQTNLQLVNSVFAHDFYPTSKLEFHVCLPMPAEEIDTYISKFLDNMLSSFTIEIFCLNQ